MTTNAILPDSPDQTDPYLLIASFLRYHYNNSKATALAYKGDIEHYFSFLRQTSALFNTLDSANSYYLHLSHRGYKPRTINRKIASIRSFVNFYLQQMQSNVPNAFSTLGKAKVADKPSIYTDEEISKLLECIGNESLELKRVRDLVLVNLLIETGFRAHTIGQLSLRSLTKDEQNNLVLTVKEKGSKYISRAITGHTTRLLLTYAEAYGHESLASFLAGERKPSKSVTLIKKGQSQPVFLGLRVSRKRGGDYEVNPAGRLTQSGLSKLFKAYSEKVGIYITPHVLRAFSGYKIYEQYGMLAAKEHLGHADLATTEAYLKKFFKIDYRKTLRVFEQYHIGKQASYTKSP